MDMSSIGISFYGYGCCSRSHISSSLENNQKHVFLQSIGSPSISARLRQRSHPSPIGSMSASPRSLQSLKPVRAATTAVEVEKEIGAVKPAPSLPFRVGHGFDLHSLEPRLPLIIGGINTPHDRGCEAHSDGDVLLHCVVDAIFGAQGLPDIRQIFPDTGPKWRGASSSVFLKEVVKLMHDAGFELGNLDATLFLQRPKLSPHKESIRTNLCELLGADPSVVILKQKLMKRLTALGRTEVSQRIPWFL